MEREAVSVPATPRTPHTMMQSAFSSPSYTKQPGATPVKSMFSTPQHVTPTTSHNPKVAYLQQASPCLHTPNSNRKGFHGNQHSTPNIRTPSSTSSLRLTPGLHTPSGPTYNPFDTAVLDRLSGPIFSPNVFAQTESTGNTPKSFKWDIDQLSRMKPVDIDEMPLHQDTLGIINPEFEERAQRAIDAYFSSHNIAPSPMTNSTPKPFVLPQTPKTPGYDSPMVYSARAPSRGPTTRETVGAAKAVSCQTELTLPMDFDLQSVLAERYTYTEPAPADLCAVTAVESELSTSTLRRKLFFHGDVGTPYSPVSRPTKPEGMDFNVSPPVSPVKCHTPKHSSQRTPSGYTPGQFSSSPIAGPAVSREFTTPGMRRCSTAPDLMDSPSFSPIISCGRTDRRVDVCGTPRTCPMQATPSSNRIMVPFDSPGMSPIILGSYSNTPQSGLGCKSVSRRGYGPLTKVPVPPELCLEDSPHSSQGSTPTTPSPTNPRDLSIQQMEMSDIDHENYASPFGCDDDHPSDESTPHGGPVFTMSDVFSGSGHGMYSEDSNDTSQDAALQTYFVSQDTGYNTNSLQLTSQSSQDPAILSVHEPALQHTNLTQQFGKMPISGHDTGIDFNDASDTDSRGSEVGTAHTKYFSKENIKSKSLTASQSDVVTAAVFYNEDAMPWPPAREPLPLTSHRLPSDTDSHSDCDDILTERQIVRRARRVLGKSLSMDDSWFHESVSADSARPKLISAIGVDPLNNSVTSTPRRRKVAKFNKDKVLPSELASQALEKANSDFARYNAWSEDGDIIIEQDSADEADMRVSASAEF